MLSTRLTIVTSNRELLPLQLNAETAIIDNFLYVIFKIPYDIGGYHHRYWTKISNSVDIIFGDDERHCKIDEIWMQENTFHMVGLKCEIIANERMIDNKGSLSYSVEVMRKAEEKRRKALLKLDEKHSQQKTKISEQRIGKKSKILKEWECWLADDYVMEECVADEEVIRAERILKRKSRKQRVKQLKQSQINNLQMLIS